MNIAVLLNGIRCAMVADRKRCDNDYAEDIGAGGAGEGKSKEEDVPMYDAHT